MAKEPQKSLPPKLYHLTSGVLKFLETCEAKYPAKAQSEKKKGDDLK